MIDKEIEHKITQWYDVGEYLYGKDLKKGTEYFNKTYHKAGKNAGDIKELEEDYKAITKETKVIEGKDGDLRKKINDYVSYGREIFTKNEVARNEAYTYMEKNGLMPQLESERPHTKPENQKQSSPDKEEEYRRRKAEEEYRRRKAEEEYRRRKAEEEYRRREAEEEDRRRKAEEDQERRAYEAEKAEQARQRQQSAHTQKKRSSWKRWILFLVIILIAIGIIHKIHTNKNNDEQQQASDYSQPTQTYSSPEPSYSNRPTQTYPTPSTTSSTSNSESYSTTLESEETAQTVDISPLLDELDKQFASSGGKSNVETCAEYGAIDGLRHVNEVLREAETAAPSNAKVKKYRQQFKKTLEQYNVKL